MRGGVDSPRAYARDHLLVISNLPAALGPFHKVGNPDRYLSNERS